MNPIQESASMTFADAHRTLMGIGYVPARTRGSHTTYKKSNHENVVISKHGKEIGPASFDDVKRAVKVHKIRNLAEAVVEGNLILAKELFEEILKEKLQEKLEDKRKQLIFKESNGNFKYHLNVTQPHAAFEKNIRHRENLEKKLDVLSKKGINK